MALVRVGLGAVLFAPKRRFMVSLETSRVKVRELRGSCVGSGCGEVLSGDVGRGEVLSGDVGRGKVLMVKAPGSSECRCRTPRQSAPRPNISAGFTPLRHVSSARMLMCLALSNTAPNSLEADLELT